MSDFERYIAGPIAKGDVAETVRMWRGEYASARWCGWTALHCVCWDVCGDREGVVRVLLDRGCDIEAETDDDLDMLRNQSIFKSLIVGYSPSQILPDDIRRRIGWKPLHFCAAWGHRGAMRVLLEAGCCPTAHTADGVTPLDIAERYNHRECVSMLWDAQQTRELLDIIDLLKIDVLSKFVEPETWKILFDKLLNYKDQRVLEAIKAQQVDEQEIEEWKSLKLHQIDSQTVQSLHGCLVYRCIHQQYDRCVYSLCTADTVNNASLFMGATALETAVDCGAVVWVHEILRKLVRVDESWSAAEDIARKKDLSDISELIAKRRDYLNRKAEKGISRLHIAVIENDADMVEYLIKRGLVGADETHKNLGTALSLAYNIDNIDCIQRLQDSNVNVDTVDRFMQTPLHIAIANRTEDMCEYLVDHTRDLECVDVFGLTALAQSVLNDCNNICERLVRKGALCDNDIEIMPQLLKVDPEISNIPRMPITNRETIYSLCLKSNRTIYPCLLASLDHRSVNQPDGNNNSLLHLSAVSFMPELCSQLISEFADVNCKNDSGGTPLLELLKQNNSRYINNTKLIETVNVLIDGGASLNVEDVNGCSVLEKATLFHNERLLLALIHKCDPIDRIKKTQWLTWMNRRQFTMIRKVIPLINKALLGDWITRKLIINRLADNDISLATMMYDHGSYEVKTAVVEAMLYRAAIVGDTPLFVRIIKNDVSANSCLDGGESLLNLLIRERRKDFIQLVIRSRNGPWFMEKKNIQGELPLHVCIKDDYWAVTVQLIAETSSVNEQDNDGNTALSLLLTKMSETEDDSAIDRLMTSVKLLINKSADVYLLNRLNRTVISYCTKFDLKSDIESFFRRQPTRQESANVCTICEDKERNCALNCGHLLCMTCARKTIYCYVCRRRITDRRKLFV